DLYVTLRCLEVLTPGIKSVTTQQQPVCVGTLRERLFDRERENGHVLRVFENREPGSMLVSAHALQALEHLVSCNSQTAVAGVFLGKHRAPDRMSVQHRPGPPHADDSQV